MTAPGWAKHLVGVDPKSVNSRAALAKLPVLRKSDISALQKENPPFGGLNVTPPGKARRLLMSPGPIFEPEGEGDDWWGAARALFAAGFRAATSCTIPSPITSRPAASFSNPARMRSAARSFPAASAIPSSSSRRSRITSRSGYVGTPDFLKILLDTAEKTGKDASSIKRGLVSGAALPASLREELRGRGVAVLQCYATAELGVIAYESEAREGMIVNETVIVEIVRPGTGDPVPEGEVGEVVVTSFNPDYPMIRLGTGDLSALMPGVSPCGRTNTRIKGWMGRADQTAKVKGMFVHPKQVAEVAARHPRAQAAAACGRPRGRAGHHDAAGGMCAVRTPRSKRRSPRRCSRSPSSKVR